ncbi:hypothetical protein DXG01_007619, partial [Tephrocybe rancida]
IQIPLLLHHVPFPIGRSLAQLVGLHLAPMLRMKPSSRLVHCRRRSPIAQWQKFPIRVPLLSLAHCLFCLLVVHLQTLMTVMRPLRLRSLIALRLLHLPPRSRV